MKKFYPFIPLIGIILVGISVFTNNDESFNLDNRWVYWGSLLIQLITIPTITLLIALS